MLPLKSAEELKIKGLLDCIPVFVLMGRRRKIVAKLPLIGSSGIINKPLEIDTSEPVFTTESSVIIEERIETENYEPLSNIEEEIIPEMETIEEEKIDVLVSVRKEPEPNGEPEQFHEDITVEENIKRKKRINFDNFDSRAVGARPVNSPTSVEACRIYGVSPEDLVKKGKRNYYMVGMTKENWKARYRFMEKLRKDKLQEVIKIYEQLKNNTYYEESKIFKYKPPVKTMEEMRKKEKMKLSKINERRKAEVAQAILTELARHEKEKEILKKFEENEKRLEHLKEEKKKREKEKKISNIEKEKKRIEKALKKNELDQKKRKILMEKQAHTEQLLSSIIEHRTNDLRKRFFNSRLKGEGKLDYVKRKLKAEEYEREKMREAIDENIQKHEEFRQEKSELIHKRRQRTMYNILQRKKVKDYLFEMQVKKVYKPPSWLDVNLDDYKHIMENQLKRRSLTSFSHLDNDKNERSISQPSPQLYYSLDELDSKPASEPNASNSEGNNFRNGRKKGGSESDLRNHFKLEHHPAEGSLSKNSSNKSDYYTSPYLEKMKLHAAEKRKWSCGKSKLIRIEPSTHPSLSDSPYLSELLPLEESKKKAKKSKKGHYLNSEHSHSNDEQNHQDNGDKDSIIEEELEQQPSNQQQEQVANDEIGSNVLPEEQQQSL